MSRPDAPAPWPAVDFRRLVDAFADAVVATDGSGRIVYLNAAAETLLGWPAGELLGQRLTKLLPERMRPAHERGFARYMSTHEPRLIGRPIRVPALRHDGTEIDIELVLATVPAPGGGELIVGALRDLRERVELERQIALTRYAGAATRLATQLSGRLSLDQILHNVVAALAGDFEAALARVWLYDRERHALDLRASAGLSHETENSSRAHIQVGSYPYKVGHVARTRQPFVGSSLRDDPQFEPEWIERERIAAAAVYPLLVGGELKGVLASFFRQPLAPELTDLLGTVAAMVAYSVNDAHLFEREQSARRAAEAAAVRARRLEAVTTVALTHTTLDDLLRALLARLRETLEIDSAAILLLAEDEPVLTLSAAVGPDSETHEQMRIPLGCGVAGRIAQTRQPLVIDDLAGVEVLTPMVREKQRSLMGAPLLVGGSLIGVVHVGTFAPHHFTDEEMRILQLAAERMAVAIDRVRLFDAERIARAQAEQAQERVSFLSEASSLLSSSLDFQVTLTRVAQLAVLELCDWCMVDIVEDEGTTRPIAIAHVDPPKAELLREIMRRWPQPPERTTGAPRVIATGKSELIADVTDEMLVQAAQDAEHLAALRSMGVRSAMVVRLQARERVLGAISLVSARPGRRYGPDDLAMAEELARRAAAAVDNALLLKAAEAAVALRDEFLSIASHELRTPLTALQLQVQSILMGAHRSQGPTISPERIVARLHNAERQIERLAKLIGELLDLSRIGQGRVPLLLQQVDFARVVRDAAGRMTEQAARAGCVVELRMEGPAIGLWDRSRLEQVVTNLLSNAIKYGAGRPVEVTLSADRDTARLTVSDQGIGIAPEHLERIFGRFERAVSARHYGGLGLGLYIVRQIVDALEGRVMVSSRPGQGASFTVELPRIGPQRKATLLPQTAVADGAIDRKS